VLPIDDLKRQAELCLQLILPLKSHRWRSRDDDEVDATAQEKFARYEASFDGFTEADIVSNQ